MADSGNYWTTVFKGRHSRRTFLKVAAGAGVGLGGLSFLGCGGGAAKPATDGTKGSTTPKYGGVLHWFDPGELPHMDPYETENRLAQRGALGVVYQYLVDYDWSGDQTTIGGKIIPRLAESWTTPDEATYVFKLRQNVKWHDGVEFTSADVKFSYDFNMDPKNALPGRSLLGSIGKVEAPDKFTVKITVKTPAAGFLSLLPNEALPIAPKHLLEKDRQGLANKPVGTGPFMVEKFDPATGVVYKKNPNYYVPGRPYLDGMTQVLITDWSAKSAAFMSKQVDILTVSDKPQYESIKAAVPDIQLRTWPSTSNNSLFYNYTRPPFNDVRVRRAAQLAVDQKGLLDRLYGGDGMVNPPVLAGSMTNWAIPQEELLKMPGFRKPKDQDLAEAKRLLAEAGYPNGLKVVTICNADASLGPKHLQVIAEQLRAVGITVEQQCVERTMHAQRGRAGDFDIAFTPYAGFGDEPDRRLYPSVYSKGASNYGKLSDPKLDEMIDRQSRTFNEQERRKIVQDIQRYMIEQAYHTPGPDPFSYGMMHSYVRNYDPAYSNTPHPHPRAEAEEIWLDK